mgnify:CR=1 FL=1
MELYHLGIFLFGMWIMILLVAILEEFEKH